MGNEPRDKIVIRLDDAAAPPKDKIVIRSDELTPSRAAVHAAPQFPTPAPAPPPQSPPNNRVPPANSIMAGVLIVGVLIVAAVLIRMDMARAPNKKDTTRYWNQMLQIVNQTPTRASQAKSAGQKAQAFREGAKQMATLDTAGVNKDVALHATDVAAWYRDWASIWERVAVLETRWLQSQQHYGSPEAAVEAFLRGMSGDPFGKFNEFLAADRELQSEFENIQRDMQQAAAHGDQLTHEGQRLVIKLK